MTSKIFQTNHQNRWFNIEAVDVEGSVIGLLELAIKVVSPVTGSLASVDKMSSLFTGPLAPIAAWCIWPLECRHRSSMRHLLLPDCQH